MAYFLINNSYKWFIAIIFFLGGSYIFFKSKYDRPYYNEIVNDLIIIWNGIFAWSSIILLFAMLM